MTITLKSVDKFEYKISNLVINEVFYQKHVGVIYDSKMSFNPHIDYIIEKSLKKFNVIRFLCRRVRGKVWIRIYTTYIRSILEYFNLSLVLNQTQSMKLEKIQRK